jgi:hypothetical protein
MAWCTLHAVLLSLALLHTVSYVTSAPCGQTVLSENFNHYQGSYKEWSKDALKRDFPQGEGRKGSDGVVRKPGLIFGKGFERSMVHSTYR